MSARIDDSGETGTTGETSGGDGVDGAGGADRAGGVGDPEETSTTGITRSPPPSSVSIALAAATVSLVATTLGAVIAVGPAALGVVALGIGMHRGSRRALTYAGAAFFVAIVVAGLRGAGPEVLVVGTLGAILAWDVGDYGVGVGEQLGREADTTRLVLAHTAVSLVVGAVAAAVAYGVFVGAAGGQPLTALVFLLLGAVALVASLHG